MIFLVIKNPVVISLLLIYTVYLLVTLSGSVLFKEDFKVRPAFFKLNFLYLLMMVLLIADSILRGIHFSVNA